jgi:hypothetical protein
MPAQTGSDNSELFFDSAIDTLFEPEGSAIFYAKRKAEKRELAIQRAVPQSNQQ